MLLRSRGWRAMTRSFHTAGQGGLAAGSGLGREGGCPCPQAPRAGRGGGVSEAQASVVRINAVIPKGALGRKETQAGLPPTLPKEGPRGWRVGDGCANLLADGCIDRKSSS